MSSNKEHGRQIVEKLFSVDLRALAAVRILIAALLLIDLLQRTQLREAFFGLHNVYPRELADLFRPFPFSLYMLSDSPALYDLLTGLYVFCAVCLLIGWRAKVMSALCWYFLSALHIRSPALQNAGDDLMRLILLWGIFLPLGACWSIDSWRRPRWIDNKRILSFASAGIKLQVFMVFQIAGLAKLHGNTWLSGAAVELVFHDLVFARPAALYLQQSPLLLTTLTYSTLVLEIFGPFLLFWPGRAIVRHIGLIALAMFSITLGSCIELGLIPFILLTAFIPFLPSSLFDRIFSSPKMASPEYVSQRKPGRTVAFLERLIPALLCVFIVLSGWHSVQPYYLLPPQIVRLGQKLLLDQSWWMYAPDAGVGLQSVTISGWRQSAEPVEFLFGVGHEKVAALPELSLFWNNFRAKTVLVHRLINPNRRPDTVFFLRWVCERWNERYPADQLKKVALRLNQSNPNMRDIASTYSAYRCGNALLLDDLK